jgi:GntR family transcriptional regulator/MocR family aminotransferase
MAIQWAGSSPELLLPLHRDQAEPLRTQLECGLRDAIRSGQLTVGERLPSSRELARALGVSRGLVQEVFDQLRAEGYLRAKPGSATIVAAGVQEGGPESAPTEVDAPPSTRHLTVDFRTGVPDLASFPRNDWSWALRGACRDAPTAALDYGDPHGSPVLREVLSAYLRRVRGAAVSADRLLICTGFAQGLTIALRALAAIGVSTVAFEDPGYGDTAAECALGGVEGVPVAVDDEGIDVDELDSTGARAVVLTAAHQWPTGVVLSPARRQALIEWAIRRDAYIIEDDYDAEFRYDREPVGALQGLAPDRVALVGTVSKSLAPSIRLGWIACPPALSTAIAEQKEASDRGSPTLDQLALASLIESGRYDRHLRRMRIAYAARRTALVEALAHEAPAVALSGLAAGFHAVAHLPATLAEPDVIAAAAARSVGLYGMSMYRADQTTTPPQLVLGFGNLNARDIHAGIATIGDILSPRRRRR